MKNFIYFIFLCCCFNTAFAFEQLIIEPNQGRSPLLTEIRQAKSSIELVMYGITDYSFIDALIKAKKSGKEVKIILEPSPYLSEDENKNAINNFRHADIELATPNPNVRLTHQKTFIFDHRKALIMTFNLTHSSFKNERNFALLTDDRQIVKEIEQVFQADFSHQAVPLAENNLVWSPNNSRQKINNFIKEACSNIKIYAQSIADYQIIGTLAKKARAGVKIQLLLSEPNQKHRRKYDYLTRAGVKISFSQTYKIHAKVIIVDDEKALLGSINLTKSSLNDNRELSVITTNKDIVQQLIKTFNQDWRGEREVNVKHLTQHQVVNIAKLINKLARTLVNATN